MVCRELDQSKPLPTLSSTFSSHFPYHKKSYFWEAGDLPIKLWFCILNLPVCGWIPPENSDSLEAPKCQKKGKKIILFWVSKMSWKQGIVLFSSVIMIASWIDRIRREGKSWGGVQMSTENDHRLINNLEMCWFGFSLRKKLQVDNVLVCLSVIHITIWIVFYKAEAYVTAGMGDWWPSSLTIGYASWG